MSRVSKEFEAAMAVTATIAFFVQLAYAHRIWRLSFHDVYLTSAIVTLSIIALGCGGALVAKTIRYPLWNDSRPSNLPASIFFVSTIACDVLIATSQVYLFHKSRSGIGRLGGLITKLTVLVVNVGLITSVDITIFLILVRDLTAQLGRSSYAITYSFSLVPRMEYF
ncbi:hypothetical protein SERLA73DRAFT_80091 [Serpula lacrymans var. lacrymans S7.3]|uniref:DUF6534 domain-containing protein n=1 Tax=Serpula lacrymans var. lacrymans (strain S7.3) TaxID=936435 RepID=F8QIN9_SERL3|nr:hypothetical protein SERLA73DRAFT_80091 [Serpula lacrymans var. lacrymans S7.3]